MSWPLIALIVVLCFIGFAGVALLLGLPVFGGQNLFGSSSQGNVRNLVQVQRSTTSSIRDTTDQRRKSVIQAAQREDQIRKTNSSRLNLRKRLRFAQLDLHPTIYYLLQVVLSLIAFAVVNLMFSNPLLRLASLLSGPLFMNWVVNTRMNSRFKAFDKDYPTFLLSLIGLLKTGMNALTALQAASEGLEEGSLVKEEIDLMLERLRLGVPEDQSIGSFGEDVFHEEIELFVQALLLSRRVGGNLSDTLDRLAKQVRKRQYFRSSAVAAISQQRFSIWVIIGILVAISIYMSFMVPDVVFGTWKDPTGRQVVEGCLLMILGGIYWIRQVTKIKV